ncbi:MAG TPA: NADPH-dependent FMN reductase, partial [Burkholderiales bacterium]|nr:NADPH-dependent FMN reductase [Burkholderiales bacterium]
MTTVRKGQAPGNLTRAEFSKRFLHAYIDPRFDAERAGIGRLEEIAWQNYCDGRKTPRTRKAGPEFADPDCDLSVEWVAARDKLREVVARQQTASSPSRVLVICAAARNDGTCPGEISKTFRLSNVAIEVLKAGGIETDLLDLSLLTSEYGRRIFPCKGCVST